MFTGITYRLTQILLSVPDQYIYTVEYSGISPRPVHLYSRVFWSQSQTGTSIQSSILVSVPDQYIYAVEYSGFSPRPVHLCSRVFWFQSQTSTSMQ